MNIRSRYACRLAGLIVIAAMPSVHADVMSLAPGGSGEFLVRNLQTQGMSQSTITTPNGANAGTVAGRDAQDRVYFITGSSGAQTLQNLPYALASSSAGIGLSAGYRVTHAAYDAQRTRIVSFAFDIPLTSAFINAINPATAATTVIKQVDPVWESYRAGVIAYLPSPNQLYMVGRTGQVSEDGLLRFDLNSAASPLMPVEFDLAGEVVLALAAHPSTGVLYGLSTSSSNSITRLVRFDFTPGFAVVALGVGDMDCCSVLVGSPAIDVATNAFYAVTRKANDPARLRRFNLSTGVITELGTTVSAGLFADPTPPLFDRIFANGFD